MIFQSDDGVTLHGQLFLPRNASGKVPGLVFMHGGPIRQMMLGFHYMDYYHNAYAVNQYLASRGYAVLSVNYRLGVMYGRAFREAPNTVWRGAAEYKDVVAGGTVSAIASGRGSEKDWAVGWFVRRLFDRDGSGAQFRSVQGRSGFPRGA